MHFVKRLLKYIGKLFIAFLLLLAFMWFLIWSEVRRDNRLAEERLDEILPPLNEMLAEKYNPSDFHIELAGESHVHVVVSKEERNSDTFLEDSYGIAQMVSKYAKQHPNQFALNTADEFVLTIDEDEYDTNQSSALEFTNSYSYYSEWKHENVYQYYSELVNVRVYAVNIKGIFAFEKIMYLYLDTRIVDYGKMIEEVVKMPNLKFIEIGNGDKISLEEEKKYAEKLHENGINSRFIRLSSK